MLQIILHLFLFHRLEIRKGEIKESRFNISNPAKKWKRKKKLHFGGKVGKKFMDLICRNKKNGFCLPLPKNPNQLGLTTNILTSFLWVKIKKFFQTFVTVAPTRKTKTLFHILNFKVKNLNFTFSAFVLLSLEADDVTNSNPRTLKVSFAYFAHV